MIGSAPSRAPFALAATAALCAAQLALYAAASGPLAYGVMSDEYYYLDCASRLDWGYVDHPPLSIALLAALRAALGDSIFALHLLPALAACANWLLLALLARELGGGRTAQALAAAAGFSAPVLQAVAGFYSMNALEPPLWTGAAWLLARIGNGAGLSTWAALGALLGLGLLNKISVLWLGFAPDEVAAALAAAGLEAPRVEMQPAPSRAADLLETFVASARKPARAGGSAR